MQETPNNHCSPANTPTGLLQIAIADLTLAVRVRLGMFEQSEVADLYHTACGMRHVVSGSKVGQWRDTHTKSRSHCKFHANHFGRLPMPQKSETIKLQVSSHASSLQKRIPSLEQGAVFTKVIPSSNMFAFNL